MLFDLESPGRKNVVRVVFGLLAAFMVVGLVAFGVGSGLPGILGGDGASLGSSDDIKKYEKAVKENPKDYKAQASLISARVDKAIKDQPADETVLNEKVKASLEQAKTEWTAYIKNVPGTPDARAASAMATAFSEPALNDPKGLVQALTVVTNDRVKAAKKLGEKVNPSNYLTLARAEMLAKSDRLATIHFNAAKAAARSNSERKTIIASIKQIKAYTKAVRAGKTPPSAPKTSNKTVTIK